MGSRLRWSSLAAVGFLALLVMGLAVSHSRAAQDSGYGPALAVLAWQDPNGPPRARGLAFHARLQLDHPAFIVSLPLATRTRLQTDGYQVELLDPDTVGKVYYFVDSGILPDMAGQLAARFGTLLEPAPGVLLVGVPVAQEQALVETLPAAGVALSLLSPRGQATPGQESGTFIAESRSTGAEPQVAQLLPLLTEEALDTLIQDLSGERPVTLRDRTVSLDTRYTFSSRIPEAEQYIFESLESQGLTPTYEPWTRGQFGGRNIVADLPGTLHPERVWLVGGHFDTNSEVPYQRSPGADDNATGVAATLLLASLLKDHTFAETIRFVFFSGEEQGQWGSEVYAAELGQTGVQVQGYINLDMIGWDGNGDRLLEVHSGTGPNANGLATVLLDVADRYDLGVQFEHKTTSASRFSDHRSFWDNGYPAVLVIENFFTDQVPHDRNPWYHTTGDRASRVDLDYSSRIGRVALAAVAELAGIQPDGTPTPTVTATPTHSVTPTATGTVTGTQTATVTMTTTGTATATSTPTETPSATPSASPSALPMPTGCVDLIVDGGFEDNSPAWVSSGGVPGKRVQPAAYQGQWGLQLGLLPADTNHYAYSEVYQRLTLPAWADSATLRFWERPGGLADAELGGDLRDLLLLDASFGLVARLDQNRADGDERWRQRTFDISGYMEQELILYFNVRNDGTGSTMWNSIDEVELLVCPATDGTPSPTPTGTDTAAATLTATPDASPSATATSSTTPTPTATSTATATRTVAAAGMHLPLILNGTRPVGPATSTPSPTASSTPTGTATPTPTSTSTETATPTFTPSATATPSATSTASATFTPLATASSTPSATETPTPAGGNSPLATPTSR